MSLIAVIIPYYQQKPGLLRRAMQSVIDQVGMDHHLIQAIVVDDSSPHPAESELVGLVAKSNVSIVIVSKSNGGPGSARNAGIDKASDCGVDYIAFLDSDDWWAPLHLCRAMTALSGRNGSFYCSNSMHDNVTSFSYFSSFNRLVDLEDKETAFGVVSSEEAFDMMLLECLTHTSQVVYSLRPYWKLRFNPDFRRSGEDHLFWLSILRQSSPMLYTTQVMGFRGRGVSVYRDSLNWDSVTYFDRLLEASSFRDIVSKSFSLNPSQAYANRLMRKEVFEDISFMLLRSAFRSPATFISNLRKLRLERQDGLFKGVMSAIPHVWRTQRRLNQGRL